MIIGLDVGDTHTDVVLVDRDGLKKEIKVRTDPSDLFQSVLSGLDAAACQHARPSLGVMSATVDPFHARRAAELAHADDERRIKPAAIFQIANQGRHRDIELPAEGMPHLTTDGLALYMTDIGTGEQRDVPRPTVVRTLPAGLLSSSTLKELYLQGNASARNCVLS